MTYTKEDIIYIIKNLPERKDERYSKFIQTHFEDNKITLLQYLEGKLRELACYSEGKYRLCILQNNSIIYFNKDAYDFPVPTGIWMDWWEKDFKKYFGITLDSYKKMDRKSRALLEIKLEMKVGWPKTEYFSLFAEFYDSVEYDRWWWDDTIPMSEKQGMKKEEYWKEKFFEDESNLKEKIMIKISKAIVSWEEGLPIIKIEGKDFEGNIRVKNIFLEYITSSGIDAVDLKDIKDKLEHD